jgi:hypothetical protein
MPRGPCHRPVARNDRFCWIFENCNIDVFRIDCHLLVLVLVLLLIVLALLDSHWGGVCLHQAGFGTCLAGRLEVGQMCLYTLFKAYAYACPLLFSCAVVHIGKGAH